ncbi:hypothetical protein [Glycomyces harbinensis]|uniref:Uncharacterized protein n=1 Tax=Glycomyces harbinensis TaxID=58114 RepID=A0A1G7AF76_9ACTN|nr:hypothetical protein [Glycomyces harbinensis]SDE12526.1 hypothetical protein SAMN05216270_11364 [Glycomyces harbinensis]
MHPAPNPPPPAVNPPPRTPTVPRAVDPIAAVAGNATGFGLGYMLLGRWRFAAAALAGTGFLVYAMATDPENPWWRLGFGAWWLAMGLHARHLTRKTEPQPLLDFDRPGSPPRERLLAVGGAGLALLLVLGLRADAWLTVLRAEHDHAAGDCGSATDALESFEAAHRAAFGPMVIEGEDQLAACRILNEARAQDPATGADTVATYMEHPAALWEGAGPERAGMLFDAAREGGDVADLMRLGFGQLIDTLANDPDQSRRVRGTVEALMADLADDTPVCTAATVDTWLNGQTWEAPSLGEPIAAAADQVPARLLACARERADIGDLTGARVAYRQFLADHPDHADAQPAADELYDVEYRIEYDTATTLLGQGAYCDDPSPWRGAPAYEGQGPHAMWTLGLSAEQYDFPGSWIADSVDETVLVTCVDGPSMGEFQESCRYSSPSDEVIWLSFFAARFDITVYELRTGEVVDQYSREIGDPCPDSFYYRNVNVVQSGYSAADVRELFHPIQD